MNWDVPDLEDSEAGEGEEDLPVQAGQLVVAQVPANMQHACTDHGSFWYIRDSKNYEK